MEESKYPTLKIINTEEKKYINNEGNIIIEKIIYVKEKSKPLKEYQKEAQKDAQKKYYQKNKEKLNNNTKEYRKLKYNNDEVYRERILSLKKESYKKKKELNNIK
jgi:hypothetical protein